MPVLAVIPGNTLDDLNDKGLGARLEDYFNPRRFFDRVVIFSPFEKVRREASGMLVVPARDIELPALIKQHHVSLVRAYGAGTPADMAVFYRSPGAAVVVSVHDKRLSTMRPGIRHADMVFVVSDELSRIVVTRGVSAQRVMVVPNGVDDGLMRPLPPEDFAALSARYPFKHKLLHVGRKSAEKNIEAIIGALAQLGPDYGLVAVGQGDAASCQAMALAQGVSERCIFLPGVPQHQLAAFYNWADCVCHPSRSEAMCNVLLEALACGAAIVTTEVAAAGLGDGLSRAMCLVRDPEDVTALAAQLRRVCQEPGVRDALRAGARESVAPFFLGRAQDREVACYRHVLDMQERGSFRRTWREDICLAGANISRRAARFLGRGL